jgi:Uncharacterised methyltransferase family (DUF6094)
LEVNVRNVARIKLGYYPLPLEEGRRLRKLLDFSTAPASVVDPCVGTGEALHQLTEGAATEKHGVELDGNRAAAAAASNVVPWMEHSVKWTIASLLGQCPAEQTIWTCGLRSVTGFNKTDLYVDADTCGLVGLHAGFASLTRPNFETRGLNDDGR